MIFMKIFLMIPPSVLYQIAFSHNLMSYDCIILAQSCNLLINLWPLEYSSYFPLCRDLRVMLGFYFFVHLILVLSLSGRSETLGVNVTKDCM
jgi:hypothetical protein